MSVFLMYHHIGDDPNADRRYVVSEQNFAAQLAHLQEDGYEVVSVGHALTQPESHTRRVVITFDDGSASDYLTAAPLLRRYGFGATFYVVPGLLGHSGFMTEAQTIEMMRWGFEIGSHSMSHRYLTDLDTLTLHDEIVGSKRRLEQLLGRRVRHFACPGGRVDWRVRRVVQEAGYDSLATSRAGVNHGGSDAYRLSRVAMYNNTSAADFRRLCSGHGMLARRLPEIALGAAKRILGNSSYDRLRRALLSRSH
jgi:peptidoglycan/xylan/chitin deacetylase (PgdA/CDA1 family)